MSIQYVNAKQFSSAKELLAHYGNVRRRLKTRVDLERLVEAVKDENAALRKQNQRLKTIIAESGSQIVAGPTVLLQLIESACVRFAVSRVELFGIRRTQRISDARQAVMALACKLTRMSMPDIGRRIGGRDHTTVLHARNKLNPLIEQITLDLNEAPSVWVNALAELMPKWTRTGSNQFEAPEQADDLSTQQSPIVMVPHEQTEIARA